MWERNTSFLFFFKKKGRMCFYLSCIVSEIVCIANILCHITKINFFECPCWSSFFFKSYFSSLFLSSLSQKERVAGWGGGGKRRERKKASLFQQKHFAFWRSERGFHRDIYIYISVGFLLFDISTNKWKRGLQVFYIHQKNLEQNKITPERESNLWRKKKKRPFF